jgi:hypothetical protein
MSRRILFLAVMLVAVLAGCLPRGRALLPNVPTRAPAAPVEAAVPRTAALPFDLRSPMPVLTALDALPAYAGPGRDFEALHVLQVGQRAGIVGRNLDNTWLALAGPGDENGAPAWVAAENVVVEGDVDLVAILE